MLTFGAKGCDKVRSMKQVAKTIRLPRDVWDRIDRIARGSRNTPKPKSIDVVRIAISKGLRAAGKVLNTK